jgi:hypothetical protein
MAEHLREVRHQFFWQPKLAEGWVPGVIPMTPMSIWKEVQQFEGSWRG